MLRNILDRHKIHRSSNNLEALQLGKSRVPS